MNDVVAFVQQNWLIALGVALMVLMHTVGHGAHGRGGHGAHGGAHADDQRDDRTDLREPLDRGSASRGPCA